MARYRESLADIVSRQHPNSDAAKFLRTAHVYDASEIIRGIDGVWDFVESRQQCYDAEHEWRESEAYKTAAAAFVRHTVGYDGRTVIDIGDPLPLPEHIERLNKATKQMSDEVKSATHWRTIGPIAKPFDEVWVEGWYHHELGCVVRFRDSDEPDWKWVVTFGFSNAGNATQSPLVVRIGHDGVACEDDLQRMSDLYSAFAWGLVLYPVMMTLCLASRPTKFIRVAEQDDSARRKYAKRWGRELNKRRIVTIPRRPIKYGTGGHDGTRRCLHWVAGYWRNRELPSRKYVDPYLRGDPALGFCKTSYWAKCMVRSQANRHIEMIAA